MLTVGITARRAKMLFALHSTSRTFGLRQCVCARFRLMHSLKNSAILCDGAACCEFRSLASTVSSLRDKKQCASHSRKRARLH